MIHHNPQIHALQCVYLSRTRLQWSSSRSIALYDHSCHEWHQEHWPERQMGIVCHVGSREHPYEISAQTEKIYSISITILGSLHWLQKQQPTWPSSACTSQELWGYGHLIWQLSHHLVFNLTVCSKKQVHINLTIISNYNFSFYLWVKIKVHLCDIFG